MKMNWDDPAHRLALIEIVGIPEYNRLHAEQRERETIGTENGYKLRRVGSRFGSLVQVVGTDSAFATLIEARNYAQTLAPGPQP